MLKKQRNTQLLVSSHSKQISVVFGITIITAVAVALAIFSQVTKLFLSK